MIHVRQGMLHDIIPQMAPTWSLKISFNITGEAISSHQNIIHFTTGGDKETYGSRTPMLYLQRGSFNLMVKSSVNGMIGFIVCDGILVSENSENTVEVKQTRNEQNIVRITTVINGIICSNITNNDARSFQNVKVYTGDPWHSAANVIITSYEFKNILD